MERFVDEGRPAGWLAAIQVEVLMLDSTGPNGQQNQVAFLPVAPLPVDHRVTFAFENEDREPALVAVLSGVRAELVGENVPILQGSVIQRSAVQIVAEPSLARHLFRTIAAVDYDLSASGT